MYINIWSTSLITINSLRARQTMSRENLTGFTTPTSGWNRKYLSLRKQKHWYFFKKFLLLAPKIWLAQILGELQCPSTPRSVRLYLITKIDYSFLSFFCIPKFLPMMSHTDTFSEPHIVMHNRAFHMTLRSHIGVRKQGNGSHVGVPNQWNGGHVGAPQK